MKMSKWKILFSMTIILAGAFLCERAHCLEVENMLLTGEVGNRIRIAPVTYYAILAAPVAVDGDRAEKAAPKSAHAAACHSNFQYGVNASAVKKIPDIGYCAQGDKCA